MSPVKPDALRVSEVASRIQCNPKTVYALIARGQLRAVRLGRVLRVPAESLEAFLNGEGQRATRREARDTEPLSAAELAAIRRSLRQIQRGETITLEQYRRKHGL